MRGFTVPREYARRGNLLGYWTVVTADSHSCHEHNYFFSSLAWQAKPDAKRWRSCVAVLKEGTRVNGIPHCRRFGSLPAGLATFVETSKLVVCARIKVTCHSIKKWYQDDDPNPDDIIWWYWAEISPDLLLVRSSPQSHASIHPSHGEEAPPRKKKTTQSWG